MKRIILSIVALAALASCQKSDCNTPEATEVSFTSGIATRATDNLWEAGDRIGVYMFDGAYLNFDDPKSINVEYTLSEESDGTSEGTFTSATPLYFPNNRNVDFVAYYPYRDGGDDGVLTFNTFDQTSAEKIKALDFMVACARSCNNENTPSLLFRRKMSRVLIDVVRKDSNENAAIADISLLGVATKGTYEIHNYDGNPIEASTSLSGIDLFENDNHKIEAIVIPQTATSAMLLLNIDGESVSVTLSETFVKNKQYNYTLAVGGDEVKFTRSSIVDWMQKDAGELGSTRKYSYVEFKRNEPNTANMTKAENTGAIENLLAKFRRCLMTTDGNGNATICYLDNNKSTLYNDGSAAALDGTEGDVMVYFPEFWYKYENIDDDYFRYNFSEREITGYIHVEASLVGAYKAHNENNMVYSRSGVTPTGNVSQADFKSYAAARGTGYQIINYEQHCTIAMMLYAKYLDRDTQAKLGFGDAKPTTITGTTNFIGNADTKNESSAWVNGLGIEGVFGGIAEWIEGVEVNNYVWTITNPTENTTREVTASSSDGYITELSLENGSYFDMVPTVSSGGSSATYFADDYGYGYFGGSYSGCVVYRSSDYAFADGGVASTNAGYDSSSTGTYIGSRLAFRGSITEAASVAEYKALFENN